MKYFSIILLTTLFYILFSFKPEIGTYNARLFMNDFSKAGVADWLFYEVRVNLFLILISVLGAIYTPKKFIKNVFIAIGIDGVLTLFRFIVFGYHDEPSYVAPITNAIPLSYILYSYFIYGRVD